MVLRFRRSVEVSFSNDTVHIGAFDPVEEPASDQKLPVPSRIRNLLDDGIHRDSQEIAHILGLPISTTKTILSKYKDLKWTMIGGQGRRATKWTVSNPIRKVMTKVDDLPKLTEVGNVYEPRKPLMNNNYFINFKVDTSKLITTGPL